MLSGVAAVSVSRSGTVTGFEVGTQILHGGARGP
jgi:hypothetical protein